MFAENKAKMIEFKYKFLLEKNDPVVWNGKKTKTTPKLTKM